MKDIFDLIKKSSVVRKYKREIIPDNLIERIIQAGRWSLSVHGFQPWKFVLIKNREIIKKIGDISEKKASTLFAGYNLILKFTSNVIKNANILIAVYNDGSIVNYTKRCKKPYTHYARISELQCLGAAIQNIFLEANSLGIGVAWLNVPLFCKKEINNLLGKKEELMALLSLGYPFNSIRQRSKRKNYKDSVETII